MVSSGANSGAWSKIPVPSNWETKGFGTYHYGWQEDFEKNEIGYYKHTFVSDAHWKNKTVKLVFEGSMTDTEVKVNGKSDRKSTRLNSSHVKISYAVFCLKKKKRI